jgi:hypothetical protein
LAEAIDSWAEPTGDQAELLRLAHDGSLDTVICPHCGQQFQPHAAGVPGLHQCSSCGRPYDVKITETPLGVAYVTTAVKPT